MRAGEAPDANAGNQKARSDAFKRWLSCWIKSQTLLPESDDPIAMSAIAWSESGGMKLLRRQTLRSKPAFRLH